MLKLIKRVIPKAKKIFGLNQKRLHPIKYWEERASRYHGRSVFNLGHTEDEIETVTKIQKEIIFPFLKQQLKGDEVLALDIGCGTGRFTRDLATTIHGKAIGVDPVEHLLSLAKKDNNVEYRVMTEGRLPVESSSIDIVWICLVLGGIVDDNMLLNTVLEVKRVLKKDGLVFLVENTDDKDSSDYWKFRQFEQYRSLFDFVALDHLADYYDLGERISIMAGRRSDMINQDKQSKGCEPFFIVGCDRSGTTLLRLMLNAHSEIDVPDESDYIAYLIDQKCLSWDLRDDDNLRAVYDKIASVQRLINWGIDMSAVKERIFASDRSIKNVFAAPFEIHMEAKSKKRWGDKTPRYTLYIPEIRGIFPQAYFIYMKRDGRDVAASLKKVSWFSHNMIDIAFYWKKMIKSGHAEKRFFNPRFIEISYEQLVIDPLFTLERVCNFLGVSFEKEMFEYYTSADTEFNEMYRGDHSMLRQKPNPSRIGTWRRQLNKKEIEIFEFIAGDELEQAGYERSVNLSILSVFSIFIELVSYSTRRVVQRFLSKEAL